MKLGAGFIPVRKKGKLPYKTIQESYSLEYGEDILEIHEDALEKGEGKGISVSIFGSLRVRQEPWTEVKGNRIDVPRIS